jgi:hypothetical protein
MSRSKSRKQSEAGNGAKNLFDNAQQADVEKTYQMSLVSGVGTRLFHIWLYTVKFRKYRFSQK